MRKIIMLASALSVALPVATVLPATSASARHRHSSYAYRQQNGAYRGQDAEYYCQRHGGTTGAVIGGAGGALLGRALGGTTATILGAAGGALAGREIERGRSQRRCRDGR